MIYHQLIHKLIFPILFCFLLFSCERSYSPIASLYENGILEYVITGGGGYNKTNIDEKGNVYFIYFTGLHGIYEISTLLSKQKFDSLTKIFYVNDFWSLSDKYSPMIPVVDGTDIFICYKTGSKSKTILIEADAD